MSLTQNDSETVLLHNPNCSKSRATKALLAEREIPFRERLYLKEPLDQSELEELEAYLGRPIASWVRTRESAYQEAGLSADSSAEDLRSAVAERPILMERPIVVKGGAARVGRPPEDVLELFD